MEVKWGGLNIGGEDERTVSLHPHPPLWFLSSIIDSRTTEGEDGVQEK